MPVKPPIFVSSEEFLVFASIAEAESYLEPVDVGPGDRGYDAEGRLLEVRVCQEPTWKLAPLDREGRPARTRLVLAEEAPGHAEELRARLRAYLNDCRASGAESEGLPAMVERARRVHEREVAAWGTTRRRAGWIFLIGLAALLGAWGWWRMNR